MTPIRRRPRILLDTTCMHILIVACAAAMRRKCGYAWQHTHGPLAPGLNGYVGMRLCAFLTCTPNLGWMHGHSCILAQHMSSVQNAPAVSVAAAITLASYIIHRAVFHLCYAVDHPFSLICKVLRSYNVYPAVVISWVRPHMTYATYAPQSEICETA